MDKKSLIGVSFILAIAVVCVLSLFLCSKNYDQDTNKVEGVVLYTTDSTLTLRDSNHIIYTMEVQDINVSVGDNILIKYTGVLDKNSEKQDISIVDYTVLPILEDENGIPSDWLDDGIFSDYYLLAYNKLQTLTLDEKIGQLFLVRYPDVEAIDDLKKYCFSGFVFYEKDFKGKSKKEVIDMIDNLQDASTIPLLTAVDEEGGKVVRVSSNPLLATSPFKSSRELYNEGDFELIHYDTLAKSELLSSLGLNLNLAPVVDVSTDPNSYIYERTFSEDAIATAKYARIVIRASKENSVSYTLKHFPGYGNNSDTHIDASIDNRTYDDIINNDILPFTVGIEEGAEAILVSHKIVNAIDSDNPASLSASVHNLLRNELKFTGIVMTDDLGMNALSSVDDVAVKAILAGNDLIISTDYETDIADVKLAIQDGTISEETINRLAFRVLTWKYYKGLMFQGK